MAYAARDGTTANDGEGKNSPYTGALLRHLETPGLELEFLFRNVRDDVLSATNGVQQPFLYGSLSRDEIYLNPAAQSDIATSVAAADPEAETAQAATITWTFVQATSDADTLRRFVRKFPDSSQVGLAKQRIALLETAPQSDAPPVGAFSLASDQSVAVSLDEEAARISRPFRRTTPAVALAWNVVRESKDVDVVRRFADHFPSARRRAVAVARMDQFIFTPYRRTAEATCPAQPLVTRDALLEVTHDDDVLRCFRLDDVNAPACRNARERYPRISRFTYDYRFRFSLCEALGDTCGGRREFLTSGVSLQSKALFNPQNTDAANRSIPSAPGGGFSFDPPPPPSTRPRLRLRRVPRQEVERAARRPRTVLSLRFIFGRRNIRNGVGGSYLKTKLNGLTSVRGSVSSPGAPTIGARHRAIRLPSTPTVKLNAVTPTVKINTQLRPSGLRR